jgi:hypothetical protein
MDLALFYGLMDENMLATGKTENNMAGVSISCQMDNPKSGSGVRVKRCDGLTINRI